MARRHGAFLGGLRGFGKFLLGGEGSGEGEGAVIECAQVGGVEAGGGELALVGVEAASPGGHLVLASESPDGLACRGDGVLGTIGAAEEAHPGGVVVELMGLAGGFGWGDDAAEVAMVLIGLALPGALPLAAKGIGLGGCSGLIPSALETGASARSETQAEEGGEEESDGGEDVGSHAGGG